MAKPQSSAICRAEGYTNWSQFNTYIISYLSQLTATLFDKT